MVMLVTLIWRLPTHVHEMKPPFWEISEVIRGNQRLIFDIVANSIMLLPLGILLPLWIKKANSPKKTAIAGLILSMVIELIQLITTRGLFEIDDLFHNTLGAFIGGFIGCPLANWIFSRESGHKQ